MPTVSLTPTPSTVVVGSSVTLTCSPSLSDASQYSEANVNFQYHLNEGSVFRNINLPISGVVVQTDSPQLKINTSSAGNYTCTVTINGEDISTITGSSTSGQDMAQIIAESKHTNVP